MAMMYSFASSASVAEYIILLMMWDMLINLPLFGGTSLWLDRKNFPPVRLLALGTLR